MHATAKKPLNFQARFVMVVSTPQKRESHLVPARMIRTMGGWHAYESYYKPLDGKRISNR